MIDRKKELFSFMRDNPDLPVIPMVASEIVADDGYSYWSGSLGRSRIKDYIVGEERVHFRDENEIEDTLTDGHYTYEEFEEMDDDEAKRAYGALPWKKAIIVYIELP